MNPTHPAPVKRRQALVRRHILDHGMRPGNGRLLVAVSGGADSTALLLLLHRLSKPLRLHLHVAHFDHGLRGHDAARRDEAFVRQLCQSLGLPLTLGSAKVRENARRKHIGLEDAARRERYAFLARVAAEADCTAVATGHTASDQAETVLLHLVRGTGLHGLAGMAPAGPWPFPGHDGLRLLRPLLKLSRSDTQAVCDAFGVQPIEDESNASPQFRRNRIRHEVLPLLRDLNPRIEDALVRLAANAREGADYAESGARTLISTTSVTPSPKSERGQGVRSSRTLSETHPALRHTAITLALKAAAGDTQEFTQRQYDAIDRLLTSGATGDSIDLSRDITAKLEQNDLLIAKRTPKPAVLPDGEVAVTCASTEHFGHIRVTLSLSQPMAGMIAEVDTSAVEGGVRVRRRRDGDRFQPLGMSGTKKLQDFFVDARVPRDQRDSVPIFESARGIVWVGGLRIAEWAKPRPGAPTVFLSYELATD